MTIRDAGIKCPECSTTNSEVIESRPTHGNTRFRRRRFCDSCSLRWTTIEKIAPDPEFSRLPRHGPNSPRGDASNGVGATPVIGQSNPSNSVPGTQLAGSNGPDARTRARSGSGSGDLYPEGSIQEIATGDEPAKTRIRRPRRSAAPAVQTGTPIGEFAFVCRGDGPRTAAGTVVWWLTQEQLADWERLYPGLNVLNEIRHALAWTQARQSHRKTWTGYPAFLVGWLNKSANARPAPPVVNAAAAAARAEQERRERAARNGTRRGEPTPIASIAPPAPWTPEQIAEAETLRKRTTKTGGTP